MTCTAIGYRIQASAEEISVDVTLTGEVPPWRPSTGYVLFGVDRSLNSPGFPRCPRRVTITYSVDSERHETMGAATTTTGKEEICVGRSEQLSGAGSGAATAPVFVEMTLRVNGVERSLVVDTRMSLLDLLRERLGLTGAKKGCDHGQCGACTILLDGRRVNSCLALAVAHQGAELVTVEGLAEAGELHELQRAFIAHDGFQCGYCTPGQLCSAVGMLREVVAGWPSSVTPQLAAAGIQLTDEEIRERMSGNLCRCGAYGNIVAAIMEVTP